MKAALVGLIGCRAGLKAFVGAAGERAGGGLNFEGFWVWGGR